MNLQQMHYLCEIERLRFNFSEVARTLHTSQPGITRQVQMLESELGFEVLERRGRRIIGITREGQTVLAAARRMQAEVDGLRSFSKEHQSRLRGRLRIATTYFHARYTLFDAVLGFRKVNPKVVLELQQGNPSEIAQLVASDEADLGISIEVSRPSRDLACISCDINSQTGERVLIVPTGHPLLKVRKLTLPLLAEHPMIMYDPKFGVGAGVMHTFDRNNLTPNIILTATDADVIKAYVVSGLGIAILQKAVFNTKRDPALRSIEISHLFQTGKTVFMLRRGAKVSDLTTDFISIVSPSVKATMVRQAVEV